MYHLASMTIKAVYVSTQLHRPTTQASYTAAQTHSLPVDDGPAPGGGFICPKSSSRQNTEVTAARRTAKTHPPQT